MQSISLFKDEFAHKLCGKAKQQDILDTFRYPNKHLLSSRWTSCLDVEKQITCSLPCSSWIKRNTDSIAIKRTIHMASETAKGRSWRKQRSGKIRFIYKAHRASSQMFQMGEDFNAASDGWQLTCFISKRNCSPDPFATAQGLFWVQTWLVKALQ